MRWSLPRVRLAAAAGIGWVALSWTAYYAGTSFTTTAFGISSSRPNHYWNSKSVAVRWQRNQGAWWVLHSSTSEGHNLSHDKEIPEVVESPVLRLVYPALVEFFQEYGHADIPLKSTAGKQCKTLRRLATQGKLTEDETTLLTSLHFRFNSLEQVYEEADFDELLQRLLAYEKETESGYQIPKKYKPDPELGAWVTALRRLRKRDLAMKDDDNYNDGINHNSLLQPDHVEQLNQVGFAWISNRQCGSLESSHSSEENDLYRDILDEAVALYASLAMSTMDDHLNHEKVQHYHQEAIMTLVEDATLLHNERISMNRRGPTSISMTTQELNQDDERAVLFRNIQERLDQAVLYASSSSENPLTTTEESERIMSTIVSLAKEYHSRLHSHDDNDYDALIVRSHSNDSSYPVVHHTKDDDDEALQELRRRLEHIKASIHDNENVSVSEPPTIIATEPTYHFASKDEALSDYHFASIQIDEPEKVPPPKDATRSSSVSNTRIMEQPNESWSGSSTNHSRDEDDISSLSVSSDDIHDSSHSNELKEERIQETNTSGSKQQDEEDVVDVAIVGAGIGGLCAGAILNTLYGKTVGIYESHYLPGGCAHAFPYSNQNQTFIFDSGPTIVLGCSAPPYNPLRQVLNVVGLGTEVEWLPYQGWGMIEQTHTSSTTNNDANGKPTKPLQWKVELGPNAFQSGPLLEFGGPDAVEEFEALREASKGLVQGAVAIPAMAMRAGKASLLPLLRYLPALMELIQLGPELTQGTFAPFMDGPLFVVKNKWLRDWLDALAFSLSGLPASRTAAGSMAYVLYDMHREGAALDYPKGGMGSVIAALVKGVEQGSSGKSQVHLRSHVECLDTTPDGSRFTGLTLRGGKRVKAREGIIFNAPIWTLPQMVHNENAKRALNKGILPSQPQQQASSSSSPPQSWTIPTDPNQRPLLSKKRPKSSDESATTTSPAQGSLLEQCDTTEMTGSFLHLHLALDAKGLDLDGMEAHYTVMDRGLGGSPDDPEDGPCGELNMIAVSNPCVLDRTLAPEGYMVVHAYGAGNEPYDLWKTLKRNSPEYKRLKEERAAVLWRAVESIIPDARERVVLDLTGSPLTHERFLRRPRGTYGAATEDYLPDGSTPFKSLVLCGDSIFPGIGVPAVALSGASAANTMVNPFQQWQCLDTLKRKGLL